MYGSARNARAFRRPSESEGVPPPPEASEEDSSEAGEADPSAPPSLYAALGVSPSADQETIRRAFRQLATSLHPDKARDPAAREDATRLFARIQHAYEVLSDPDLRDVYDVYGEEGLEAGTQVAVRPRGAQARGAQRGADASAGSGGGGGGGAGSSQPPPPPPEPQPEVEHRGQYVFKVDATALVDPYDRRARTLPDLRGVFVSSGVDVPIDTTDWGALASASDVAHIGGLVSVQRSQGGGSFVAGYKRVYDDSSSYEVQAVVGLQTLVSATSSIQLSRHADASLTATWQPGLGPGLQFETSRQLSEKYHGQFGWTLGPEPLAGMHLSVTRRSPGLLMLGRVDVGATTALAVRVAKRLAKSITGRIGAKLTPAGPEFEAGGSRRLNDLDACGMRAVAAPHGVSLRLSYSRGLHAFECPILLSPQPNPVVAIAAAVVPPFSVWVAESLIFKPLSRGIRRRRREAVRRAAAEAIEEGLRSQEAAQRLLEPVATRRATAEANKHGLFVAAAVYGPREAAEQLLDALVAGERPPVGLARREAAVASEGATADPSPSEDEDDASSQGGPRDAPLAIDVTVGVRYMVSNGAIVFYRGYARSGIMGFCDPAPGEDKVLLVLYEFEGRPFQAAVHDFESGKLPSQSHHLARNDARAVFIGRQADAVRAQSAQR